MQIWDVRGPQHVQQDWPGGRFRLKTRLPTKQTDTIEKLLFNVGLDIPFAGAAGTGSMKDCLVGRSTREQTTTGEVIRYWGYLVRSRSIWHGRGENVAEGPSPRRHMPPRDMGRHGMAKNRFLHFNHLQSQMFSVDESELDRVIRGVTRDARGLVQSTPRKLIVQAGFSLEMNQ